MTRDKQPPAVLLRFQSRWFLILGFGGLLALMTFTGVDVIEVLRRIQRSNDEIQQDFIARNRVLDQIRSDLYLSGTYVRDYLLEPESAKADAHLLSLKKTRSEMDAALGQYRKLISPAESAPFAGLTGELAAYWKLLDPVLEWRPEQRRSGGYVFLRDEVFPRRTAMLGVAGQIAAINESQLNAGRRRVSEIFSEFRRRLIITAGLSIALGLLLAIVTMSKILNLEGVAIARYGEIAQARSELKELSARLVEAQENERRTISRELHDQVGQGLSGALVELGNLSAAIRNKDTGTLGDRVAEIKSLIEDCANVVRNMALLLRPSMLDDLGLLPALEWQAREVSRRTGMRVKIAADELPDRLPEEHKTCIYRVVQEAINNSYRHAGARLVRVTLKREPSRLFLSIQDDGKGLSENQGRGLGLLGMKERVSHLGGTFQLESEPGHGATLAISLPLQAEGMAGPEGMA